MSESLKLYLKEIDKYPLLDREEETALFIKIKTGDKIAKEKIINSNLRFVVSIAKKFINRGIPLEDLISEGNIGLIESVDKFDLCKGVKFITYSSWWIRKCIFRTIYDKSKTIRLPEQAFVKAMRIKKEMDLIEDSFTYKQKINMVAKRLEMDDPQEVSYLTKMYEETTSLESEIIYDNRVLSLKETISDEHVDVENTVINNQYKEIIFNILDSCKRDLKILDLRFGLTDNYSLSLEEIGQQVNLTKERVRQIQEKILKKLRSEKKVLELTYQ